MIAEILKRFEGVKSLSPDNWIARCPAHADKTPSLSIRHSQGKVLLKCFGGCDTDDVLAAAGLGWRDLFDDKDSWKASASAAAYTGYRRAAKHTETDPIKFERMLLEMAAAEMNAGGELSLEDKARVKLAWMRING